MGSNSGGGTSSQQQQQQQQERRTSSSTSSSTNVEETKTATVTTHQTSSSSSEKEVQPNMKKEQEMVFTVDNMTCGGCGSFVRNLVESNIRKSASDGTVDIQNVHVDWRAGVLSIHGYDLTTVPATGTATTATPTEGAAATTTTDGGNVAFDIQSEIPIWLGNEGYPTKFLYME